MIALVKLVIRDLQFHEPLDPTWTKIMSSLAATVKVNTALAEFLVAIIEHTEEIFDSAPVRQESDYTERNLGEIDAQLFPNFPVIRERAYYEKKCNVEDEKSLTFMCEKVFPSHNKLTPCPFPLLEYQMVWRGGQI